MIPGVRLVVLGKQGAGKGTQCVRLSHHYVVPHVSTGDMLRSAVKSRTALGQRAAGAHGRRASSSPTSWSWRWSAAGSPSATPRAGASCSTAARAPSAQAEALEEIVEPFGLDLVIDLEVPTSLVMKRLAVAPGLRGLRRQLLDGRPAAGQLDLRRLRRRGGPARGRHRGGDRAPARPLRGARRPRCSTGTRSASLLVEVNGTGSPDAVTRRVVGGHRQRCARQMKEGAATGEAQRRRAGQDAPGRQGGGRDARGDPGRRQAGRDHRRARPGGPRGARAPGGHARTSSATTASRP